MDGHFGMAHIGGLVNTAWWNRKGSRIASRIRAYEAGLGFENKGMPSSGLLSPKPAVTRQPSFLDAYFHVVFFESSCLENVQCYSIPRAYRTYPSWVLRCLVPPRSRTSPAHPFDRPLIDTQAPSSRKRQSIHPYTQPASQPASQPAHLGCSSLKCRPLPSYPSQTAPSANSLSGAPCRARFRGGGPSA